MAKCGKFGAASTADRVLHCWAVLALGCAVKKIKILTKKKN
jgi:hypothetical protein